jgi:hypothetical protein
MPQVQAPGIDRHRQQADEQGPQDPAPPRVLRLQAPMDDAGGRGRMTLAYHKTLNFAGSPTVWDMINDPSFIRVIRGAVGSGKSTGMCAEIMRLAMCQEPAADGWRYCKAGVVRNTYGELMTTTLATWRSIYPEEVFGPVRHGAPITHHIRIPGDNGNPGIDLLVEFMALDRVKDVKKLLSWEGSVIWFNELREVAKQIFDAATARVGRYPSKAQRGVNCTRAAILGDTNPPDEDHWLYALERDDPEGFAFFDQPPAVLELHEVDWDYRPADVIEAAGTHYVVNPDAENLDNLPEGYYRRMLPGKDLEWIAVYAQGRYGFVADGKPVVPEYRDDLMARDDLPVLEDRPLLMGIDIGGGTLAPAAIVGQLHERGIWLIHLEVCALDMGLERFSTQVVQDVATTFPNRNIDRAWADPAGNQRDPLFEQTIIDHMRHSAGIPTFAAPTNDIRSRITAWRTPMGRLIDGQPGVLLNRQHCRTLRAGLSGRWRYRRMQISGTERFSEKPEKNDYSHPCDAGGYLLLGGGEFRSMKGRDKSMTRPTSHRAKTEFKVF